VTLSPTVYQLSVALDDIEPAVWRRLQVPADFTLEKLHYVLQDALGWQNSHLHEFRIGDARYGLILADEPDPTLRDDRRIHLRDVAGKGSRFTYVYDFGDDWMHSIHVEEVLASNPTVKVPRCTGGARAAPPEDSGGPSGYMELVAALADPENERNRELAQWIDAEFDPARFDLAATNEALWSSRTETLTRRAARHDRADRRRLS
jgi:hypothetical protein